MDVMYELHMEGDKVEIGITGIVEVKMDEEQLVVESIVIKNTGIIKQFH